MAHILGQFTIFQRFKQQGVSLKPTTPLSVLNQAFIKTQYYAKTICLKSNLHQELIQITLGPRCRHYLHHAQYEEAINVLQLIPYQQLLPTLRSLTLGEEVVQDFCLYARTQQHDDIFSALVIMTPTCLDKTYQTYVVELKQGLALLEKNALLQEKDVRQAVIREPTLASSLIRAIIKLKSANLNRCINLFQADIRDALVNEPKEANELANIMLVLLQLDLHHLTAFRYALFESKPKNRACLLSKIQILHRESLSLLYDPAFQESVLTDPNIIRTTADKIIRTMAGSATAPPRPK